MVDDTAPFIFTCLPRCVSFCVRYPSFVIGFATRRCTSLLQLVQEERGSHGRQPVLLGWSEPVLLTRMCGTWRLSSRNLTRAALGSPPASLHPFTFKLKQRDFKLKRRDFKLKRREFKLKHRTSNYNTQSSNEITKVKLKHKTLNLRQRGFKF